MTKTYAEIDAMVREIFAVVCASGAPLSMLGKKITSLVDIQKWSIDDAERVSGGVMELLIKRRGWQRLCHVSVEGEL